MPWGFLGGVALDLLSGGPFGTAALALVLVAFCASAGASGVFRSNALLPVVIVFWASVVYGLLFLVLLRTHHYPVDWLGTVRHTILPSAILNAALSPLPYALLGRLERRTRPIASVDW